MNDKNETDKARIDDMMVDEIAYYRKMLYQMVVELEGHQDSQRKAISAFVSLVILEDHLKAYLFFRKTPPSFKEVLERVNEKYKKMFKNLADK